MFVSKLEANNVTFIYSLMLNLAPNEVQRYKDFCNYKNISHKRREEL